MQWTYRIPSYDLITHPYRLFVWEWKATQSASSRDNKWCHASLPTHKGMWIIWTPAMTSEYFKTWLSFGRAKCQTCRQTVQEVRYPLTRVEVERSVIRIDCNSELNHFVRPSLISYRWKTMFFIDTKNLFTKSTVTEKGHRLIATRHGNSVIENWFVVAHSVCGLADSPSDGILAETAINADIYKCVQQLATRNN